MLKRCLSGVKRHLVDAEASNDELHTKVRALETNILHLERLLRQKEKEQLHVQDSTMRSSSVTTPPPSSSRTKYMETDVGSAASLQERLEDNLNKHAVDIAVLEEKLQASL
jgi:hypothetical protein